MSQRRRLTVVLALNLTMIVSLVLVGLSAHSLGVLAAGGDYVADSTAIGLGILAVTIRDRSGSTRRPRPPSPESTPPPYSSSRSSCSPRPSAG